ncbi:MAG: MFS transporter [Gemmatimonadales bacterium]|nr:MFS transporter [Gemmatimonadales bacterium]
MIGLACVASFIAYILRINMSVAGEALAADLRLSRVQLGLVLGAFAWGYALFQFPGGLLGDRFGARRALTVVVVAWGLCNLLPGVLPGTAVLPPLALVGLLAGLRFLMGAAQAPLYPIIGGATIRLWFPVSAWGLPNAVTNAGAAFGSAAAGPLIGGLVVTLGWRQSFVLTAPMAFLFAALWWWYYRDHPAEHRRVSTAEAAYIAGERAAGDAAPPRPGAWRALLRNRNLRLLTLSYFCSNYLFYFFFNWLVIYLVEERRFTLLQGGWYAAAPWMVGAFGALAGGFVTDRLSRRRGLTFGCRWPALVSLLCAGALIFAVARAEAPLVAVALLSACLGFQQATDPVYWAATVAVAGRDSAGACGVLNTAGNVVGGIGALLVPVTVDAFGWPVALATTAGFAVAGALLWLAVEIDG